jgi:hypothetical protein
VVAAYDFTGLRSIVDVAGGHAVTAASTSVSATTLTASNYRPQTRGKRARRTRARHPELDASGASHAIESCKQQSSSGRSRCRHRTKLAM